MSVTASDAFGLLIDDAGAGQVAHLCARQHIRLMVIFGSAAADGAEPVDLDLGVQAEQGARIDILRLVDELARLTGYEGFDVLDLDRAGPLARERALVGARLVYQASPGLFAGRQIAAIMERLDTDHLRRMELELMRP